MSNASETDLFQPVDVGALTLANRICMAPLTRSRSGSAGTPGPMNAEYYAQRASAGLIVSEATNISAAGEGLRLYAGDVRRGPGPGLEAGHRRVHAAGGKIVCQLWHVGRISHPSLQPKGEVPVAPSAAKPQSQAFTEQGFQPHVEPRALRLDEIPGVLEQYRNATALLRGRGGPLYRLSRAGPGGGVGAVVSGVEGTATTGGDRVTIYHNPRCSTSRAVLATIEASGRTPLVIEYLKTGWTRAELQDLIARAHAIPRDFLRAKEPVAAELGLTAPGVSDDAILEAMVAHPVLVERPIVATADEVRLCRPAERVSGLL